MFRTLSRLLLPNPFDAMLKKLKKRHGKKILLGWNRGLGDIALGLYAMVQRIREWIPDAEITFLTRENLKDGFSLLDSVVTLTTADWKRGESVSVVKTLEKLAIDPKKYDLIIEKPSPTDWVSWQKGTVFPKLRWDSCHDSLYEPFDLPREFTYIAVQVSAETNYGLWRNWPRVRWEELFSRLGKISHVKVLLFGFGSEPLFSSENIIDLRGKTTLFELLSIIKNLCYAALLPDSGILSMIYYLNVDFPFRLVSLWADANHGILKQAVASPNRQLLHCPLVGSHRDLSSVSVDDVMKSLFPEGISFFNKTDLTPLSECAIVGVPYHLPYKAGAIILAGGQGTRLGITGPKGTFQIGGKSLFEWICEKAPRENFPIAIMTSPLNHLDTVSFFERNHYFDREIYFFQQSLQPFLDENKKPLDISGPDGNGSVFKAFVDGGIASLFLEKQIDAVTVIPVDNPLAHPYDEPLLCHHLATQSDVTLKCIERLSPSEKMGALMQNQGRIEIVEYLHLNPSLPCKYLNTGIMTMSLPFLIKMAKIELPVHYVKKKFQLIDVLKGEKFIFDSLPYASKVEALCSPRRQCYSPVKDAGSIDLKWIEFQNS